MSTRSYYSSQWPWQNNSQCLYSQTHQHERTNRRYNPNSFWLNTAMKLSTFCKLNPWKRGQHGWMNISRPKTPVERQVEDLQLIQMKRAKICKSNFGIIVLWFVPTLVTEQICFWKKVCERTPEIKLATRNEKRVRLMKRDHTWAGELAGLIETTARPSLDMVRLYCQK